jgi:hypothetical protein
MTSTPLIITPLTNCVLFMTASEVYYHAADHYTSKVVMTSTPLTIIPMTRS